MSYRFRTGENGELVLQVEVVGAYTPYQHERPVPWRDATVSDIPVADPFRREAVDFREVQPEFIP